MARTKEAEMVGFEKKVGPLSPINLSEKVGILSGQDPALPADIRPIVRRFRPIIRPFRVIVTDTTFSEGRRL